MSTWNTSDIELLFMGFGNISIFWKEDDPLTSEDLSGSFKYNADSIVEALNELNLNIGNWEQTDFYWMISSNAGEPRGDLIKAIERVGFNCYDYFDSEEFEAPEEIKTFEAEPLLS